MLDEIKLDAIVTKINEMCEYEYDYNTRNEDCPLAEYVGSIGYGGESIHQIEEGIERLDSCGDISTTTADYLRCLLKLPKYEIVDAIRAVTILQPAFGYWRLSREIMSGEVGEIEVQICDLTHGLTPAEIVYVVKQAKYYVSIQGDFAYVFTDCRWSLVVDEFKIITEMNGAE